MNAKYQRVLHDSLLTTAASFPLKTALITDGKAYTYQELLHSACKLAVFLRTNGVKRGDRVALFMDNSWPCAVGIYGTLLAGGVFMVLNAQTKSEKLEYILNDSSASAILTDANLSSIFLPVLKNIQSLKITMCNGRIAAAAKDAIYSFDDIMNSSDEKTDATSISTDLAALIYTSGSTGDPKGVMMTHGSMVFTSESLIQYLRLNEDERIINILPFAFDYGLYQLLMSVRLGATLVLERSFAYPSQIITRVRSENVTVFPGVPTVYMTLIGMHERSPIVMESVRKVTNTAASLPPEIVPKLRAIFPNALIFRMYGLTECKRVCYLEPELIDAKPESVGKAIPGTEIFVLNEKGEPVQPGETGVLHIRGAHIMQGYWGKPELTAEMIRQGKYPGDKLLCSHDFFTIDNEGFLYFKGRSDDIIKTRGEKVSPIEVENCLHGITGIREAAVIGVPDSLLGEAIVAYVALEIGFEMTEKEIKLQCASRLENFMVPKSIIILSELPKTPNGKIRKKELKNMDVSVV